MRGKLGHRDGWALFLVLLAAGAFFYPVLLGRVLLPDRLLGVLPWALEQVRGPRHAWNPLQWDALAQYYPWRSFLAQNLGQGHLPLWNPHTFCGMPFLANAQSTVLYPFTWLFFLLLPTAQAFGWSAIFHLGVAGGGTYALLRALGTRRSAALAGALAYEFCGFLVAWAELPTLVQTAAWLPWICAGLEWARQRNCRAGAVLAGVSLGLAGLAGHLQIFLLVGLASLGYGLCRLATRRQVSLLGIAFVLGGLIASAQLLPSLELARFSHRSGGATEEGYRSYLGRALPTQNLVTAFLPNFFGNPTRGDYWGWVQVPWPDGQMAWARNPADYVEFCLYIGVLPLLLSLYALLFRRDGAVYFLTGLALFSLLLASGGFPNRFFYFHIPGFAGSGGPGRIVLLGLFAVAVLTGLGLEQWGSDPQARRRKGTGIVGGLVAIAFLGCWWLASQLVAAVEGSIPLRRIPLSGDLVHFGSFFMAGLIVLGGLPSLSRFRAPHSSFLPFSPLSIPFLIYADLWLFGHAFNPTSPPEAIYPPSRLAEQLRAEAGWARILPQVGPWSLTQAPHPVLPPNTSMALGLYDVQGYDSLYLREYKQWMNVVEGGEASPPENGNMLRLTQQTSPLLDLLGVRCVLSQSEVAAPGCRYLRGDTLKVYENTRALPRAFIVHRAERMGNRKGLRARLFSPDFDARKTVLLEPPSSPGDPNALAPPPPNLPAPSSSGDIARIVRYEANRILLTVTLAVPGWVVLSDVAFPGWEVFTDGQPQAWERADGLLRAVALPAGSHSVVWVYRPMAIRGGLFLLGLGCLGLGWGAGKGLGERYLRGRR